MKITSLFRGGLLRIALLTAILAIIVVLYVVFMIYAMPALLKPYIERKAGEIIGGEAHVEAVEVHPFDISLKIRNFSVANNTVKLTWDSLYVNAQLRSITTKSICLEELRIYKPSIEFVLGAKEGEFSAAQFATEAFLARANMPLHIERFVIQIGSLEIFDRRTEKEKYFGITPISFSLENFSTQYSSGEGNEYNLQFTGLNGGFFRWNGNLQWTPFFSEGEMEIRGLDIIQLRDFYQEFLPFSLQSGTLDLRTHYKVVETPELGFMLENAKLVLNKPSFLTDSLGPSMQAANMQMNSLSLSTLNRSLSAGNVILDSASAFYVLHGISNINPRPFEFIRHNAKAPDFVDSNENMFNAFLKKFSNLPHWQIKIDSMESRHMQVKVIDSIFAPLTEYNLNNMQLFFKNITNNAEDSVLFNGFSSLNSGKLNLQGVVNLFPLRVSANLNLADYPLALLQNYLSQEIWLTARQGEIAARLNARFSPALDSLQKDTLLVTGEAEIDTLRLLSKNNQDFVRARQVELKGLHLMLAPTTSLRVTNVNFHAPVVNLTWYANSPANFSQIKKQKPKSDKSEQKPFQYAINQINFNKGALFLLDRDPDTYFSYRMNALQGNLKNISNQNRNMNLFMQGKMSGYAPFSVKGVINLSKKHPEYKIDIESANQDLVVFSPYSGKYAGYRIAKGQVALKADYVVKNNKMLGNNHIVIQHLTFGEAVKSQDATNFPVRLGVALLSDKNGVMDLDVGITGDLDDPEFNVAGLIWKVIKNLLGKAAAAPLKSLMALIGSKSEPEVIAFVPGLTQLSKDNLDVLKDLSQALLLRPQLHLDIHGNADSIHDSRALKEAQLLNKLTRNMPISAKWTSASVEKSPLRDTLFVYYQRTEKKSLQHVLQSIDSSSAGNKEELLTQTARKVWSELHDRQELSLKDLQNLANTRAQNIKMELIKIDASLGERIFVVDEGNLSKHIADLKIRER